MESIFVVTVESRSNPLLLYGWWSTLDQARHFMATQGKSMGWQRLYADRYIKPGGYAAGHIEGERVELDRFANIHELKRMA